MLRVAVVIGITSNTHGLLAPQATEALRGSQLIVHAEDIGSFDILRDLKRVAPVGATRAVLINNSAQAMPLSDVIEASGVQIFVLHNLKDLDLSPRAAGFAAVISARSHQPGMIVRDGDLHFNWGCAGPKRFHRLHLRQNRAFKCKLPGYCVGRRWR